VRGKAAVLSPESSKHRGLVKEWAKKGTATEQIASDFLNDWHLWDNLIEKLEGEDGILRVKAKWKDSWEVKGILEDVTSRRKQAGEILRDVLVDLDKQGKLPKWVDHEIAAQLRNGGKDLNLVNYRERLRAMASGINKSTDATVANATADAIPNQGQILPNEENIPLKPEPEDAVKTEAKSAQSESAASDIATKEDVHLDTKTTASFKAKTEELLSKLEKGNPSASAKVREYINLHPTDEERIVTKFESMIGNADVPLSALKDEKIVAVLAEAPAAEIAKMSKAAKALTTLGMAGDVFSIVVAYWDYKEANRKIESTNNQELKDLYADRYKYIAADVVIGSTGLVSGGLAFAGIGTAVATPVAIATLPATAVVGGLYKMHEWKEVTSMSATDIAKAEKPEEIIAKLQYKPDGEAIGQMLPRIGRYLNKPNSDEAKVTGAEYTDQKHLNLMRCTALAMNTTTISIPERMRDPDGTVRPPNAEEIKSLKEAMQVYMGAKIHYLETHANGTPTEPFANTNMAILLRDADAYAKEEHNAYVTAKQKGQEYEPQKKSEGFTDKEWKALEERKAREYAESQNMPTMQQLVTNYCLMDENIRDAVLLSTCKTLIEQKTAPFITAFKAQLLRGDTNFRQNWSDGNIPQVIENHVMRLVEAMIIQNAEKMSREISDCAKGKSASTISSLSDKPDIYASNIYRLLEKPVTQWWEELKPTEQATAESQLQAQEVLQRIAPKMKDLQKVTINSKDHYEFSTSAQIENRMKMWALKLQASENEKILNKKVLTNNGDALALARLNKGKDAIFKTLTKDHQAFDVNWEWDAEHAAAVVQLGRGNGILFIVFNPDNLKWECLRGNETTMGHRISALQLSRKNNTENIGSDPAKGIPSTGKESPAELRMHQQVTDVLKTLDVINAESNI
jgi:hypothetical protein